MLLERGLEGTDLLVVPESVLEGGLIPAPALAPVGRWLEGLASDAHARSALVRRTLEGALDSLPGRVGGVRRALDEQLDAADRLRADARQAYAAALEEVDQTVRSGSLLRGEVLARWHEVVGTGDLMRALETRVGWARDRLRAIFSGRSPAQRELTAAVETSVESVVHAAADRAAERAAAAWRQQAAGRGLAAAAPRLDRVSPELAARTEAEVRAWQGFVFELVTEEGSEKRSTARLASLGVNGAGLTVMLAVFLQTGGLTGAEVAIAGGTSAIGQKVLEAIFGDQAVRALANRAREDLLERVRGLLDGERSRFDDLLAEVEPDPESSGRLRGALRRVEQAR
jgi:hypothetical protein